VANDPTGPEQWSEIIGHRGHVSGGGDRVLDGALDEHLSGRPSQRFPDERRQ
jgi:hypothetical protein